MTLKLLSFAPPPPSQTKINFDNGKLFTSVICGSYQSGIINDHEYLTSAIIQLFFVSSNLLKEN